MEELILLSNSTYPLEHVMFSPLSRDRREIVRLLEVIPMAKSIGGGGGGFRVVR